MIPTQLVERYLARVLIGSCGVLAAGLLLAAPAPASQSASGALQIRATFAPAWQFGAFCPPGSPATVECVLFVGSVDVPGLGRATSTYTKTLGEDNGCEVTQFRTAVIDVAGKGTIELAPGGVVCGRTAPAETGPLELTMTGGSGMYAGASGMLVFASTVFGGSLECRCGKARDTWTGTLTVPGREFDVTAPVLAGAVSKSVRAAKGAKLAGVRYTVTAQDAIEGPIAVACTPRSGGRFRLGRTVVDCAATDASGNTGTARFTVTVKRRA